MFDVSVFILDLVIIFIVYKGIKFIGKFEFGKTALTFYLVVNIAGEFIGLLLKVLK